MAVLIQPIAGRQYGKMFYPELAGAAFSKVFRRPSPRIKKDDGVARICFGLGTRTVDRAYARTFYLTNPNLRPEGTKPHEIVTHSQEHYDYVDLEKQGFASEHVAYTVRDIIKKHRMAQTYLQWFDDNSFHWIHTDTSNMNAPRPVFTFSELPSRCPKLAYEASDDRFTLVQMRPLSVYDDKGKVSIPDVPLEKTILRGDRMVANGRLEGTKHIIYVDPEIYGKKADEGGLLRGRARRGRGERQARRRTLHTRRPGPLGQLEPDARRPRALRRAVELRLPG